MQIMKIICLFILLLPLCLWAQSDSLDGHIVGATAEGTEPLTEVTVMWLHTGEGTYTDSTGYFRLPAPGGWPARLVVDYPGYRTDTLTLADNSHLDHTLQPLMLEVTKVRGKIRSTELNRLSDRKVEQLGTEELYKAACCNLNESFGATASVDATYSDAATGTRDIKMLGLDGPYTLLTTEAQPYPRGLQRTGALGYMPGAWVQGLQVSKGAGSVVQGYEGIGGLININLKQPDSGELLHLNLYSGDRGRNEANLTSAIKLTNRLSMINLLHGSLQKSDVDMNMDNFADLPGTRHHNLATRWKYTTPTGWEMHWGLHHYADERRGGQYMVPDTFSMPHHGSTNMDDYRFRADMDTRMVQGYAKMGYVYPGKPYKSIGFQLDGGTWDRTGRIGGPALPVWRHFQGTQRHGRANVLYQNIYGDTRYTYVAGISLGYDDNLQVLDSLRIDMQERVAGLFYDFTWKPGPRYTLIVGMRADWHSLFGWMATPRAHLTYRPNEHWVLRLSGGTGYRTPYALADNLGMLVSGRRLQYTATLQAEQAWNVGLSATRHYNWTKGRTGYLTADLFHTRFTRQLVADRDADPLVLQLRNLQGQSYATAAQVEFSAEVIPDLDLRVAYKWYDVRQTTGGRLQQRTLVPEHRALANLAWKHKWLALDLTAQWFGTQRLPSMAPHEGTPAPATLTQPYVLLMAQATYNAKSWALYAGAENLLDYRQPELIVAAEHWSSPQLDASLVWGPPMGRMLYVGWRYTLKAKPKEKAQ